MREKYIEERHHRWFSMCVGKCDLSTVDQIEFAKAATAQDAVTIVAQYDKLLDAYIDMAQSWDTADARGFKRYWYGLGRRSSNEATT